ncbi:MAG TPA: protein kinase [Candidatus Acidoferrum sp.]|jgi:Tol biopolymer transport system component
MALTSGTKLGPYEIQSQVGAGGMGEVYRARDTRLSRDVALKILPESFALDGDRLRRFEHETQAVAALNHPNILAIYDVGHHNSAPFLVSELLEGETLRAVLDRGPLPQRKAIDYSVQIAKGLAAAHDKGIVHRDLKPDNLFVCRDGRVKILDFGLAKLASMEPHSERDGATMTMTNTAAGVVMGTASYMAPEQVRGEPVDARTDMFAFGTVLFEMLSARRAFRRDTAAETMTAILKDDVAELNDLATPISPGLDRIMRRCLEKNPEHRFQSAKDLAFALESLSNVSGTNTSGAQAAVQAKSSAARGKFLGAAVALALALGALGLGWWLGHGHDADPPPEYQPITFRSGFIGNARFTPDGSIVYSATWENSDSDLYLSRTDEVGSRELQIKDAELLAISKTGELAVRLASDNLGGYKRVGTLARIPLSGGSPREVLANVQDADWAADGQTMAVVRFVPETFHWRLEYPIGKVLFDSINWISNPKISPDGKLVAFADHENPDGDDEGAIAYINSDGHEKKVSEGWTSIEGVLWSPSGAEIWFSASNSGSSENLRAATLAGKVRTIANVPGGMWLQDARDGSILMVTQQQRLNIRALPPAGKEERELGWLGWSYLRDISRDGTKVLFEEEAEGGGPNYTSYLRDTTGSPPVRMGDGEARAVSPDNKWVITKPLKREVLMLVPTGAGEPRQLTHDKISYSTVRFLPDGKKLVAVGVEEGHGARDYLVDLSEGNSKPITPEGVAGVVVSPDGQKLAVRAPDGKLGIWPMDGSGLRTIPGVDEKYTVIGWTPDSTALYLFSSRAAERSGKVYRLDPATGKTEFWKEFGENLQAGGNSVGSPHFSADGKAYAYVYVQVLSQAYVCKGLK